MTTSLGSCRGTYFSWVQGQHLQMPKSYQWIAGTGVSIECLKADHICDRLTLLSLIWVFYIVFNED